ncbi:MAG: DUF211 domain-containing protein [Methanopyri archaeon]|nr:DUF211 domain-containing protein [Methanopyri archaeon]
MSRLRRLVLDVMKPLEPDMTVLALKLAELEGVEGVNVVLIEVDRDVENVKVTVEGPDLNFEEVKGVIEGIGGAIHSIDEVVAGERIVEEVKTPQDD